MSEKVYNLTQAAAYLELSPFYVRKCIKAGKIDATLNLIEDTQVARHEMSQEALDVFKSRERKSVGRDDNRNKFVIYLSKAELAEHTKTLQAIGADFGRANKPKSQS